MKKILNLTFILLILMFSACTDLELEPKTSSTSEVILSDEDSYRRFIAKVYAGLALTGQEGPAGQPDISSLDEGFSDYMRQYWQLQELPTDEAVIAWGDDGIQDLNVQVWTSDNQFVNAIYYRIFFQVSMANEFLRESTPDRLDARGIRAGIRSEIEQFRAEARFLRALSYFHGIDLFANIPFYTEEATVGSEPPQQVSREVVFNFIEQELSQIESTLPGPGEAQYGRVDQAAVWMLQARLYLNAEVFAGVNRYSDCVEACNKIINSGAYSLDDNYEHLFLADNHTSEEIIWAIPYDGLATQTFGGTTYLIHAPVGGDMDPADFGINGGWGGLRTTSALVDLFPDETGAVDSRAMFFTQNQSKEINDLMNFQDGYAVTKYKNVTSDGLPGQDLTHTDTDFPIFRLADVYLMYAEAVLRGGAGGDRATALGFINDIRERAYGSELGNIMDSELTLDFILEERARELYWEAKRRTDLIRFNLFTENGTWPWKGNVQDGQPTQAFRNILPIPANELLANPNLTQNPNY